MTLWLDVAEYSVDISFVGTKRMKALNAAFRQKAQSTDVLSFGLVDWRRPRGVRSVVGKIRKPTASPQHLGDIVICLDDAERNARHIGQTLDREVCYLVIHGLLHLCGHDHMKPEDDRRMRREARRLLKLVTDIRQGPLWHQCVRLRA